MPAQKRTPSHEIQSREKTVSKKLSWLLRHGANKEGLDLGPGGYANLADVLQSRTIRSLNVTLSEVAQIVSTSDKQRFSLIHMEVDNGGAARPYTDNGPIDASKITDADMAANFRIRANQGHSIKLANDGLLQRLPSGDADVFPKVIVHGTNRRAWQAILSSGGLSPMGRNHVHFATGLPPDNRFSTATQTNGAESRDQTPVISGMRTCSNILIFLDPHKAVANGLELWRSENGVILCDGGTDGIIPLSCFKKVETFGKEKAVLVSDGIVLQACAELE